MASRRQLIPDFDDFLVVDYSEDDGCWVAHSLRTDQIGTGPTKVEALADLIRAVYQVCDAAAEDESIAYLRDAAPETQALAKTVAPITAEEMDEALRLAGRGKPSEKWEPFGRRMRSARGRLQST